MRGKVRFDCRKRNMREKERVIQGGGEGRVGEYIHAGLNWIMIFLIGKTLLWRTAHECQR